MKEQTGNNNVPAAISNIERDEESEEEDETDNDEDDSGNIIKT